MKLIRFAYVNEEETLRVPDGMKFQLVSQSSIPSKFNGNEYYPQDWIGCIEYSEELEEEYCFDNALSLTTYSLGNKYLIFELNSVYIEGLPTGSLVFNGPLFFKKVEIVNPSSKCPDDWVKPIEFIKVRGIGERLVDSTIVNVKGSIERTFLHFDYFQNRHSTCIVNSTEEEFNEQFNRALRYVKG